MKKLRNFAPSAPAKREVKQQLWAGLLNDVAGKDADLLLAIKNKKLPWKTLNRAFVVKTCPELFPASLVAEIEKSGGDEVS
jgi:hypothetical protein